MQGNIVDTHQPDSMELSFVSETTKNRCIWVRIKISEYQSDIVYYIKHSYHFIYSSLENNSSDTI